MDAATCLHERDSKLNFSSIQGMGISISANLGILVRAKVLELVVTLGLAID